MKISLIAKSMLLLKLKWIILFFVVILFKSAGATGQASDLLIIEKDTFKLYSNPLEPYLEFKNKRVLNGIELEMTNTACWRGYIATWEITNDSLFLVNVIRRDGADQILTFNLKEEFGTNRVFAEWFTGSLYSPRGEILQYVHMGYSSIYEKEEYYNVWNGKVKFVESKGNLVYNDERLYPAEEFLRDTLTKIIESKFSLPLLNEIPDSLACIVEVQFNDAGKVNEVKIDLKKDAETLFGKTILKIAGEEFYKLPPLMAVTHKYYRQPCIMLFLHAYCIKYPYDKEYGCSQ